MPAGLRVWNADGTLQFDNSFSLTRLVTTLNVPASGASQTFQMPSGRVWWCVRINTISPGGTGSAYSPLVSVSASNLVTYGPNPVFGLGTIASVLVLGVY